MKGSKTDLSAGSIKGVGPRRALLLSKLGIITAEDAYHYIPIRYEDRTSLVPIERLEQGRQLTIAGEIVSINIVRLREKRLNIFEAIVHDGTAYLKLKWFNQPFMARNIKIGQRIIATGTVELNSYGMPPLAMNSPAYETVPVSEDISKSLRILPVYGLTEGLSQKQFRKIMSSIINEHASYIQDYMPLDILDRHKLPSLADAVREIHLPSSNEKLEDLNNGRTIYHRRLIFDELFLFVLGLALMKHDVTCNDGISFRSNGRLNKALIDMLPYELTSAQKRVIEEIRLDMSSSHQMHRLVQGDVGCGKTIVALSAMLDAVESGYQASLMAPTEILAAQHYLNIYRLVDALGLKLQLLSREQKRPEKNAVIDADIVVGTHALIQENVRFRKLGLVVIDEQHKFGVAQRAELREKGNRPDVLVMTATPIPRTLGLTLYGDLDCSVIDELPPGRKTVSTKWVMSSEREVIYRLLVREISKGRQAYVVYPAIEESENADLKAAVTGRDALEKKFPMFSTGLLHGKMPASERKSVMDKFRNKEIDILVCTTVIEVGVDVPNATVMIIVHAERFGLSQLHQLRGRVGRGSNESHCVLIAYEPLSADAKKRLDIMALTNDGFRIAEEDLAIRGFGDFLGTRQAGMPCLRHADLVRDSALLEDAAKEAACLAMRDPELKEYPFLKKRVDVFWKGRIDLYKTG